MGNAILVFPPSPDSNATNMPELVNATGDQTPLTLINSMQFSGNNIGLTTGLINGATVFGNVAFSGVVTLDGTTDNPVTRVYTNSATDSVTFNGVINGSGNLTA